MTRAARAVPVIAALAVVTWAPGIWVTAVCGLAILAWLLVLEPMAAVRARPAHRDVRVSAETMLIAALATIVVAAAFRLPPIAAWIAAPAGIACAVAAYAIALGTARKRSEERGVRRR